MLVHASHGLVLAVWIASAAFASIDGSLEEAARNIGASAWTCFRTITLPLAAPGLMASAIFVFLESLDEFTGTYFVGVPDVTTLPLLMFNASMGGNYQIASITALLLLRAVDRLHARRRALPEGRRAGDGGPIGRRALGAFAAGRTSSVVSSKIAALGRVIVVDVAVHNATELRIITPLRRSASDSLVARRSGSGICQATRSSTSNLRTPFPAFQQASPRDAAASG